MQVYVVTLTNYVAWQFTAFSLLFRDREHGGIQIRWNKNEEPGWAQKWNPFCTTLPYMTFSHHPVLYNPKVGIV